MFGRKGKNTQIPRKYFAVDVDPPLSDDEDLQPTVGSSSSDNSSSVSEDLSGETSGYEPVGSPTIKNKKREQKRKTDSTESKGKKKLKSSK